ncbi:MAG: fucose isomerase, partial [Bacteroidales bacterium]|nr:fucose isomerase [Bacteroidales bacterium]
MINQPTVKLGIVGVSRDCFPITLTQARLAAIMAEVKAAGLPEVYDCPVTIENDVDTYKALDWAKE